MHNSYLVYILVFIVSALICVPLAKRLGLGSVLGYLIAGIVIGPFVLNFTGEESKDIQVFAELGVVLMLFLVGLELEPQKLWKIRSLILGTGLSQIVVTSAILTPVFLLLGFNPAAALAVSLAFSMSSTAMVLQYLSEKSLMQTLAGRSAFSVLLMQDVAVIPILALLPLLGSSTEGADTHHASAFAHLPSYLQASITIASVVLVILTGKYLITPVLRAVSKSNLRELFIAASLLIVLSVSLLMELVGLSPALGAFVAGVVLANSEFKHELESDLNPFKGILLGLFFITVGATINFNHILSNPLLIIGITLGVMALKALVLWVISSVVNKASTDQKTILSVSMSQVGEFAFVLLGVILNLSIIATEQYNTLLSVVAFSMFLSPVFNLVSERLVLTRLGTKEKPDEKPDEIDNEHNKVLIIGFSHFGSTIGRLLRANGVNATILDNNSDTVDLLRKIGFKVYYGDATRVDLLHSAGAADAQLMILTVDDKDVKTQIIENVKKHFPHLKLLVRAQNRFDAYELMDMGIKDVYRETFDTSIKMGIDALTHLGFRKYAANRTGLQFAKYDQQAMEHLSSFKANKSDYIKNVRKQIQIQEELLNKDLDLNQTLGDHSWDSEYMRNEINSIKK